MRKVIAAASAAALLSFLPLAVESSAAQTRVVTGNDRAIPADSVDTTRGIDLLVRKLPANPYDEVPEGALPDGGIEGLRFTLFRADGIDVTTRQGRADAARARTEAEFDALQVTEVASRLTNSKGEVTFEGLTPGLYRLEETAPDSDHNYRVSSPRWMVLPFGAVTGESFTYENVVVVKASTPDTPGEPGESTTPTPPTPPSTPTTPTTPGTPGTSSPQPPHTTSVPPGPGAQPPEGTRERVLASTGANVLWVVAAGALLIAIGFWMSRRREDHA